MTTEKKKTILNQYVVDKNINTIVLSYLNNIN